VAKQVHPTVDLVRLMAERIRPARARLATPTVATKVDLAADPGRHQR